MESSEETESLGTVGTKAAVVPNPVLLLDSIIEERDEVEDRESDDDKDDIDQDHDDTDMSKVFCKKNRRIMNNLLCRDLHHLQYQRET
jgi:hypothetical protein